MSKAYRVVRTDGKLCDLVADTMTMPTIGGEIWFSFEINGVPIAQFRASDLRAWFTADTKQMLPQVVTFEQAP